MEINNCKFDKALYEDADKFAREKTKLAMKTLLSDSCTIEDNPDKYGVDLIIKDNNKVIGYIECERSYTWKNGSFPFPVINLPQRKEKFLSKATETVLVWFSMINHEGSKACIYDSSTAIKYDPQLVNNTRTGQEMMRRIDSKLARQIDLPI